MGRRLSTCLSNAIGDPEILIEYYVVYCLPDWMTVIITYFFLTTQPSRENGTKDLKIRRIYCSLYFEVFSSGLRISDRSLHLPFFIGE